MKMFITPSKKVATVKVVTKQDKEIQQYKEKVKMQMSLPMGNMINRIQGFRPGCGGCGK
jgi:hypothetical protein